MNHKHFIKIGDSVYKVRWAVGGGLPVRRQISPKGTTEWMELDEFTKWLEKNRPEEYILAAKLGAALNLDKNENNP